jgi:hypothetical protein
VHLKTFAEYKKESGDLPATLADDSSKAKTIVFFINQMVIIISQTTLPFNLLILLQKPSFPRKRQSISARLRGKNPTAVQLQMVPDS